MRTSFATANSETPLPCPAPASLGPSLAELSAPCRHGRLRRPASGKPMRARRPCAEFHRGAPPPWNEGDLSPPCGPPIHRSDPSLVSPFSPLPPPILSRGAPSTGRLSVCLSGEPSVTESSPYSR
ncbi:unnamed protein product [Gadus morhua 'NCC']